MNDERHRKVKASHLARDAYLYVRQATCCQGLENADRLQRQYDLRQQAAGAGLAGRTCDRHRQRHGPIGCLGHRSPRFPRRW